MLGHLFLQSWRGDILKETCVLHLPKVSGVSADEHVRFSLIALGAQAFEQLLGAAGERPHLNTGCFLEARVKRAIGIVMARGIDVDELAAAASTSGKRGGGSSQDQATAVEMKRQKGPPWPILRTVRNSACLAAEVNPQ